MATKANAPPRKISINSQPGAQIEANSTVKRQRAEHDSNNETLKGVVRPNLKSHAREHEVCLSVYEICNYYQNAVKALSDMTEASWYLRQWEGKTGDLSDLEYGWPYNEPGHDPRAGTPAFMAAEYLRGSYEFTRRAYRRAPPTPDLIARSMADLKELLEACAPLVDHKTRFNFYHDLESIFWIYIWYLHNRLPKKLMQSNPDLTSLEESAERLFYNVIAGNPSRTDLIFEPHASVQLVRILTPIYTPEFQFLVERIPVRAVLDSVYVSLEETNRVEGLWPQGQFNFEVYPVFRRTFDVMVAGMKVDADYEAQCSFISGAHVDPPTPRDRKAVAVWYHRLAEYVQRDISAGNCLRDGETGKLFNLEYAQPYNEPVGHDPRMGTPAFMSAECLYGFYYLTARGLDIGALSLSQAVEQDMADTIKELQASGPPPKDPHTTRFNFYHDLESIFWIYIWYLHYRFPKRLMQSDPNLTPLKNSAQKLFRNVIAKNCQRSDLIFEQFASVNFLKTLSPAFTPEFRVLLKCVTARCLLAHAYTLLEKTKPLDGLWDLEKFEDEYYTLMKAEFEAMIAAMKVEADHEAQCLFTSDMKRKVFEELKEGKEQSNEPAGRDAKEAHVDPTTQRDGRAVAVWYRRLAEHVQRDTSAGNCLRDGKTGKLSNLEYTQPYNKPVGYGHGPRTGTSAFMAAEYLHGKYEFTSRVSASGGLSRSQAAAQVKANMRQKHQASSPLAKDPHKTRFNFYHDLESIFWIYIWYLHYRVPKKLMQSNLNLTSLKESAETLFFNVIAENRSRTNLIFVPDASSALLNTLFPIYTPEFEVLLECVTVPSILACAYSLLEDTDPVDGLWDLAKFDDEDYTLMKADFEAMIAAMKVEADHEAQCLFTSDTKVFEESKEGKEQSNKAEGHDAEEAHVDPTTPRDRKAVAAWYIRLAGYLYHDISAENGLWNGKMVKLSELEYTRPYRKLVGHGHGPRTGTPAFMAAEYLHGYYQFTFRESSGDLPLSETGAQAKANLQKRLQASGSLAVDPHRTRFNFYHDLESIYWIYIWCLHYSLPKKLMQSNPNLTSLKESAETLFLNVIAENRSRTNLIFLEDASVDLFHILSTIYTPEHHVSLECVTARFVLTHAYTLLEKTKPVDGLWDLAKFKDEYYTVMKAEFEAMIAAMKVEADHEAQCLFTSDTKVFEDLNEGKQQSNEPAGRDAEEAHVDPSTQRDDRAVAVWYRRLAEYVQRDISAGNGLRDGKTGTLSNLEYTQPYNKPVGYGHGPRTGTSAFMAAEYLHGKYEFTSRVSASGGLSRSQAAAQVKANMRQKHQASSPLAKDPHKTRFNFYHDLESIFWIYIWYLHYRVPKKLMQSNLNLTSLKESAETLFLNVIAENRSRTNLIFLEDASVDLFHILSTIYTPEHHVSLECVTARFVLTHAYTLLEKTKPVDGLWDLAKFKDEYYTVMKAEFEAMIAAMKVEADHEAQCLFISDTKVFEDLNEGKQQSNEPAERDAEEAHVGPTTQRDGRAVAVWCCRLAEYVQRDISAGNGLRDGKTGTLSNLEYTQPYNKPVGYGHAPRTGTPAFMAAEYLHGKYKFTSRVSAHGALSMSDLMVQGKANIKKHKASGPRDDNPHRTRFNFYHDLESIFWIYIWFLHYRLPKKLMQSNPNLTPLKRSADRLFLKVIAENHERSNLILEEDASVLLLDILGPIYTPEFEHLLESVPSRLALALAYSELEPTKPVKGLWPKEQFDLEVYPVLKGEFDAMVAAMKVDTDYEAEVLFFNDKRKASTELEEGKADKKTSKKQ